MQRAECCDLKYSCLLDEHGGRVALLTSRLSVLASVGRDGRGGVLRKGRGADQVMEMLGQRVRAVRIAEWISGQFRNQIPPPQPFFDGRLEFSPQDSSHILYLIFHLLPFRRVLLCRAQY